MRVIAFIESSVFLVPADVLFMPMVLARPERAWRYALVATLASTLGGIAGYLLGALAYDAVARPVLEFYGKLDEFEQLRACTGEDTLLLLLVTSGLAHLPPIKVVTILAGVAQVSFVFFVLSCIIARGARFFALAWASQSLGRGDPPLHRDAPDPDRRRRGADPHRALFRSEVSLGARASPPADRRSFIHAQCQLSPSSSSRSSPSSVPGYSSLRATRPARSACCSAGPTTRPYCLPRSPGIWLVAKPRNQPAGAWRSGPHPGRDRHIRRLSFRRRMGLVAGPDHLRRRPQRRILLPDLNNDPVIDCSQAALRIFGLSLAGWNAVISFALAGVAWSGFRRADSP